MAEIVFSFNSLDKTLAADKWYYGPNESFTMPAFKSITSATITYTTIADSGSFRDRYVRINGTRAHTGWINSGMTLDTALIQAGANTFSPVFVSQVSAGCRWAYNLMKLTVVYELPYSIAINVGGVWKGGRPWVNVAGTWREGDAWVNVGGVWKLGQ